MGHPWFIQCRYLGIEFYLFVSHGGMNDRGSTCKFRNARSLHEKQTSRIQSFYLYFIKIVPFWLRNIRGFFLIQNTRSLFYGRHYSSLHRLMSLPGKMDVKFFLMFIVAENTRSVSCNCYSLSKAKIKFYLWYIVVSQFIKLFIFMFNILYI